MQHRLYSAPSPRPSPVGNKLFLQLPYLILPLMGIGAYRHDWGLDQLSTYLWR
ncbi:hypothetical protein P691DRAFT_807310 [Macrolepiota fuliginosa MF-IS2]|uniref:Uncharacterized protein n=1 Tax=Macrolepiota fuliginosa MF-IS2 TaxID=1400762 RepID=A0A9P5X4S9_9AGAR|nr:hypothetical protein P691DRAFT_807310 [Macrolepiota fuliginosa MF-IS2]